MTIEYLMSHALVVGFVVAYYLIGEDQVIFLFCATWALINAKDYAKGPRND